MVLKNLRKIRNSQYRYDIKAAPLRGAAFNISGQFIYPLGKGRFQFIEKRKQEMKVE